jgi:hypothetical protein
MRLSKTVTSALLAGASVLAVAACGPAVSKTPAPPVTRASSQSASTLAAPASSAPATPDNTGPLGTSYTVTTTDDKGNAVVYTVTLVKVDQRASLTQYETLTDPADHMAAARFTITGVTGQVSDDANSDAAATGSDTTEFSPSAMTVADGPNFSYGEFEAGPGQTVSGWVSFEVPPGTALASVAWQPSFEGPAATWVLSS